MRTFSVVILTLLKCNLRLSNFVTNLTVQITGFRKIAALHHLCQSSIIPDFLPTSNASNAFWKKQQREENCQNAKNYSSSLHVDCCP